MRSPVMRASGSCSPYSGSARSKRTGTTRRILHSIRHCRALLFLVALPGLALAQFQLLVSDNGNLVPAQGVVDFGSTPTGDFKDISLRLQNTTNAPATLEVLKLDNRTVFQFQGEPNLPLTLDTGKMVAFRVRFQPGAFGSYSATLTFNTTAVILTGTALPAVSVFVEESGQKRALGAGSGVSFGKADRGTVVTRHFILENQTIAALTVESVVVSGTGFQAQAVPPPPVVLQPRQSTSFDVVFQPAKPGIYTGTLEVDRQVFQLDGFVPQPPMPEIQVQVQEATLVSAQQGHVTVTLAEAAPVDAGGDLAVSFTPDNAASGQDPAIVFASSGTQSAPFTLNEGDRTARFGDLPAAAFQTGTTAGTITFNATLGDKTAQAQVRIAPAPVGVAATIVARYANSIEIRVDGYDNARSASKIAFRFYDGGGKAITSQPITADVQAAFRRYFASSDSGGTFSLRAVFPVTGDTSAIRGVEYEVENSTGRTTVPKIDF